MPEFRQLVINPGSTSTKIAVFDDETLVFEEVLRHSADEIAAYPQIIDQYAFRRDLILQSLAKHNIPINSLSAVVARGGLMKPIESGTYAVNAQMLDDLRHRPQGQHASNLGAFLAYEIAQQAGNGKAFIVDPPVVDELDEIARITGLPEIKRVSLFHALNQKAVAKRAAKDLKKKYDELNLIVAHMGGGITVGAHRQGRVVDVNNGLTGEGPFAPERAGTVSTELFIKLCYSGKYTLEEIMKMLSGKGGVVAHLGTTDMREVEKRAEEGDAKAKLVYEAMAYQISKEISRIACVLKGKIDAIILTGGIAYSKSFTDKIKDYVSFLAPVLVYPGEDELQALNEGGLRVLRGEEQVKIYA